jgi:hypothetical protein
MATIADLGRRIELVSMDPHFEEITIALYEQERDDATVAVVHSYSSKDGVNGRLESIVESMVTLAGLERASGNELAVRFPCGEWHRAAARRAFLEACKIPSDQPAEPRSLEADDGRSGQHIGVANEGSGQYRVTAEGAEDESKNRAPAIARGLAKLAEIDTNEDGTSLAFACGAEHDEIVGLLLVRALNLRATLREQEAASSRGVLAAPSAQEQT